MLLAREERIDSEVVDCLSCCEEAICTAEFMIVMVSEMAALGCVIVSLLEVVVLAFIGASLYQNTTRCITLDTRALRRVGGNMNLVLHTYAQLCRVALCLLVIDLQPQGHLAVRLGPLDC